MSNPSAEALARIEHKLDLLLEAAAQRNPSFPIRYVGQADHICPLCQTSVSYHIDMGSQTLARSCNCKTGLQAPVNLQAFAPPNPNPNEGGNNGREE